MRRCAFGRVLKDNEKCIFENALTDYCVCHRPLWRSSNQSMQKEDQK